MGAPGGHGGHGPRRVRPPSPSTRRSVHATPASPFGRPSAQAKPLAPTLSRPRPRGPPRWPSAIRSSPGAPGLRVGGRCEPDRGMQDVLGLGVVPRRAIRLPPLRRGGAAGARALSGQDGAAPRRSSTPTARRETRPERQHDVAAPRSGDSISTERSCPAFAASTSGCTSMMEPGTSWKSTIEPELGVRDKGRTPQQAPTIRGARITASHPTRQSP
jgi:hypothetical protein